MENLPVYKAVLTLEIEATKADLVELIAQASILAAQREAARNEETEREASR